MKDESLIPISFFLLVVLSLQGGEVPRGSSLSFSSMPTVGGKREITYLCPSDKNNPVIMKNLRNCYAAFLLFALLFVAAAAPAQTDLQQKLGRISAITETRPLESTRFSEKYVTYFTQPLDHRRPEKGSFRQRVIVSPRRLRPSHGDCNRRLWSRLCPQPQVSRGTFRVARCQHDFCGIPLFPGIHP